jgi:hypothetical protein
LNTDSEGLRVYVFIFSVLIISGLIFIRPKLNSFLVFLYRKAIADPRKSFLVTFSYLMILLTFWRILVEIGKILRFFGIQLSLAQFELKNPFDLMVWVLALIPLGAVAWLRLDVRQKAKQTFSSFQRTHQNWKPILIIVLYGSFSLCLALIDVIFSVLFAKDEIKNYFNQTNQGLGEDALMILGTLLVGLALSTCYILFYIGLWKRWRGCFMPYFYLCAANALTSIGIGVIKVSVFIVHFTNTANALWPRLFNIGWDWGLSPLLDMALAWLFYRWEWFEPAKVDRSPGCPDWISEPKFWWRLFWVLAILLIGNFFLNIAYLFKGPN